MKAPTTLMVLAMATLTLMAAAHADLKPGAPAPGFEVRTLAGRFTFDPKVPREGPLLVHAYNATDAFSTAMWTTPAYVDDFLLNATSNRSAVTSHHLMACTHPSPCGSEYLFVSYARYTAREEVTEMRARLLTRMLVLGFSAGDALALTLMGTWAARED